MRCLLCALILVGVNTSLGISQEIPAKIEAKIGRATEFRIQLPKDGKIGFAKGWSTSECRAVRLWNDDPSEAVFEVQPFSAGDFVLIFWLPGGTKHWRTVVDLGSSPPSPPLPPTPPIPPTPPTPPPVPPQSDLGKKLQAAYEAEQSSVSAKRGFVLSLAGFYEGVAESEWLEKEPIPTLQDMLEHLRKEREKFCPESALVPMRKVISEYMVNAFGRLPDAKVDDALRSKAKTVFSTISKSLLEVK